jgi:hypothetical protein
LAVSERGESTREAQAGPTGVRGGGTPGAEDPRSRDSCRGDCGSDGKLLASRSVYPGRNATAQNQLRLTVPFVSGTFSRCIGRSAARAEGAFQAQPGCRRLLPRQAPEWLTAADAALPCLFFQGPFREWG